MSLWSTIRLCIWHLDTLNSGGRGGVYSCHASPKSYDHRPSHPYNAGGRSTSSFHRPRRYCLHQARGTARCWASRMKGELRPTEKCFGGGLSCVWMTASNLLISVLVWPLPETAMRILCKLPRGCLNLHTIRDTIFPLERS